jgi:hypothetical protein
MKKTLTKASSKKGKKKSSKEELPSFPLRAPRLSKSSAGRRPRPIKFITKANGELETKEERKKRLAKREALLLRAFRMTYEAYHKK